MSYFEALDHTRAFGDRVRVLGYRGCPPPDAARGAAGHPQEPRRFRRKRGEPDQAAEAKLRREWSRLTPSTLVVSQPGAGFPLSTPPAQKALIEIRWEQEVRAL